MSSVKMQLDLVSASQTSSLWNLWWQRKMRICSLSLRLPAASWNFLLNFTFFHKNTGKFALYPSTYLLEQQNDVCTNPWVQLKLKKAAQCLFSGFRHPWCWEIFLSLRCMTHCSMSLHLIQPFIVIQPTPVEYNCIVCSQILVLD